MQINFNGGGQSESGTLAIAVTSLARLRLDQRKACALNLKVVSADAATTLTPVDDGVDFITLEVGRGDIISLVYDGQNHDNGTCIGALDSVPHSMDGVLDSLTTTDSATSAGTIISAATAGFAGGSFHVTSIGAGNTVSFEQSNDNVTWVALPVIHGVSATNTPSVSTASTGIYVYVSAAAYVRARVSTYSSGTITVSLTQKRSVQMVAVSLAGGAATIGSVNATIGYTDSTTALGAGATFTGTSRAASSFAPFSYFNASVYADQAGTLYIDQSLDTGATFQAVGSVAVSAGTTGQLSEKLTGIMGAATLYRVRFVNGATAQTVFRIASSATAN